MDPVRQACWSPQALNGEGPFSGRSTALAETFDLILRAEHTERTTQIRPLETSERSLTLNAGPSVAAMVVRNGPEQ